MRAFEFTTPTSKDQVSALLGNAWGEVEVLAGGTDLISLMKDDVTTPHRLVNIKGIKELQGVSVGKDVVRIGALMTLAEIAEDARIKELYPTFAEAANDAASPQIRNRATLGETFARDRAAGTSAVAMACSPRAPTANHWSLKATTATMPFWETMGRLILSALRRSRRC